MANPQNSIFEIKNFISRHRGLQRDNRYSVSFLNLPPRITPPPQEDFKVAAIAAGSRAVDGIADNLMGYGAGRIVPRSQKFVGGILLTFPVTNDNFILDFFNQWFNFIYSGGRIRGNYSMPYMVNYYDYSVAPVQMKLKFLDPNGNTNRVCTFYEVYPLECLPFEFSMAKQNDFLKYQVLLNYREYTFGVN